MTFVLMDKWLTFNIEQLSELLNVSNCTSEILVSDKTVIECRSLDRAKRITGFSICICTEGGAVFEVNSKEYTIAPGRVIAIGPNQTIRIDNQDENFRCKLLVFAKSFLVEREFDSFLYELFQFNQLTYLPVIKPEQQELSTFIQLFDTMLFVCSQEDNAARFKVIKHILLALLTAITEVYKKRKILSISKVSRKEEITIAFHNDLLQNFTKQHHPSFYANKQRITAKHLQTVIKEVTGKSPSTIINAMLIEEAKLQLQKPNQSIAAVTRNLSFSDQSFFSKFFKKHTGLLPSAYRQSLL